jgi:hypothetical protein
MKEKRITDHYNDLARQYHQAELESDWETASVCAFIMNAINNAVIKSENTNLYDYFAVHALTE